MAEPLASLNRRSENIFVHPVVVPELKFRDVQRHIFGADFVKAANNTALEDAPKALNRIGVNRADDVLAGAVADCFVWVRGSMLRAL